jgi:hypothetical protein
MAGFLFLGLKFLFKDRALFQPGNWRHWFNWRMLCSVGLLALAIHWLAHRLTSAPALMGVLDTLYVCAARALDKPGGYLLAHVIFFGPIFLLIMLRWPQVCREMSLYGPGLIIWVAVNLFLALDSESRHVFTVFPILVVFAVKAMEGINWRASHYVVFAMLSLFCSKVWLTLPGKPDHITMTVTDFPAQWFFMNYGPFISWDMYYVQGAVLILVTAILAVMLWQGTRSKPGAIHARPFRLPPDQQSPAPLAA